MNRDYDVVIPLFNAEKYIELALNSVAEQTIAPRKIVVVNDGSRDGSEAVVQKFAAEVAGHLRVDVISKANGGVNSARNVGLSACESPFVAFLDADDEWLPDKIERQMDLFGETKEQLGLVYCSFVLINEESEYLDGVFPKGEKMPIFEGDAFSDLLKGNYVYGSASGVLVKRVCFVAVGPFDETLKNCEDWDMWLRISQRFQIAFCHQAKTRIRRHSTNTQNNAPLMLEHQIRFLNKWSFWFRTEEVRLHWKNWLIDSIRDQTTFRIADRTMALDLRRKLCRVGLGPVKFVFPNLFSFLTFRFVYELSQIPVKVLNLLITAWRRYSALWRVSH